MTAQQHTNGKPIVRLLPAPVQQTVQTPQQTAGFKPYVAPPPNRFKVTTNTLSRGKTSIVDTQQPNQTPPEPTVYFTQEAMAKMKHIVAKCTLEVGWMALVKNPAPNVFLIHEVFIPTQTVTSVETDINGNAMGELAIELLDAGYDTSELYAWFHSHVNMGVTPSGQDERQVEEFLESCPVFIRGIMNKRDELKVDVYYTEHNIAYNSVPTLVYHPPLSEEKIAELDAEIAAKVTERRFTQTIYNGHQRHGLRNDPPKKNVVGHPSGPGGTQLGWDDLEWDDESGQFGYKELTELNSDIPPQGIVKPSALNRIVDTGYGEDWDETTPIHLRPQGWSLDEDYLHEGQPFDMFIN